MAPPGSSHVGILILIPLPPHAAELGTRRLNQQSHTADIDPIGIDPLIIAFQFFNDFYTFYHSSLEEVGVFSSPWQKTVKIRQISLTLVLIN
jgi:hypothetical protein